MTHAANRITHLAQTLGTAFLLLAMTYAVLAYQKYRFQNGMALGVALAAIAAFSTSGKRLGIGPDWLEKFIVGVLAAVLTTLIQKLFR